ncbi:hypothetical protein BH23GEM9_BH23GEM9_26550 [soil metagenome]
MISDAMPPTGAGPPSPQPGRPQAQGERSHAQGGLSDAQARLRRLLARLRREQVAALAVRALLGAGAVMLAIVAVLLAVDLLLVLGPEARRVLRWAPPVVFLGVALAVLRHATVALRPRTLLMLVEERRPELQHLLPTVHSAQGGGALADVLGRRAAAELAGIPARGVVRWQLRPLAGRLAAATAGIVAVLAVSAGGPAEALARWLYPASAAAWSGPGRAGIGGSAVDGSAPRFERVIVHVTPPSYSGMQPYEVSADEPIELLPGSTVRMRWQPPRQADDVRVVITGGPTLQPRLEAGSGTAQWTFAATHRAVTLEGVGSPTTGVIARRVIPLRVLPDRAPAVDIVEPETDLVLAAPRGVVTVVARAIDDFGVADFELAWVRSRGSGESFQYEEFTTPWTQLTGSSRDRTGRLTIDLATLGLQPGDAIHLRAVARDAPGAARMAAMASVAAVTPAAVAGGTGVSRTRVLRIARDDETDLVNTVIGFPLEGEEAPVLSQRMIIVMTEKLLARAASLSPDAVRAEAEHIAHEQARLRQRVGDQIYIRATGGVQDLDLEFGAEEVVGAAHDHRGDAAGHAGAGHAAHPLPLTTEERQTRERALLEAASRATGQGTLDEISHIHDESMILAVNRRLMDVYDAMWSAERELRLVQPRAALPHENRALDMLQALRQADRVFSRAPQRAPPVDVGAARGTGRLVGAEPAARSPAAVLSAPAALVRRVEAVAADLDSLTASAAALQLSALAGELLTAATRGDAGALLARAADHAARGDRRRAAELVSAARRALAPAADDVATTTMALPTRPSAAEYLRRRAERDAMTDRRVAAPGEQPAASFGSVAGARVAPFTFATLRYESGNWDSAPLVPTNVAHAIAQYTDIDVAPEGMIVDLGSDELFRQPFVFMTGHLPVRFTDEEARNLRAYVERGGFVFIDDHSHDIDGAFHRTVTAELARIFGAGTLGQLPNDHELYRTFFAFPDGPPNTPHELNGWGDGLVHEHLFAVQVNGRIGVLYSNKDYSSEWNYHHPNKRFLGLDNTRFAVNIILYALTR